SNGKSADGQWSLAHHGHRITMIDELNRPRREARDRGLLVRMAAFDPEWHQRQACEAELEGDAFAAAFHLRRLLAAYPIHANLHVRLAHALPTLGDRSGAALHLTRAFLLDPRVCPWPLNPLAADRGRQAAEAEDWPRAVRAFRLAVRQPDATAGDWGNLL